MEYLEKVWNFRAMEPNANQEIQDYDVNFTTQFICHKFRAIRSLVSCKNPPFWDEGKFYLVVISTEFQLRGLPHWHMLVCGLICLGKGKAFSLTL